MFDFKKKELSVAISMALALSGGLLISGCNSGGGDTSTAKTSGVQTEIRDPTGSIKGVVMDTNGNFIPGAKVIIGGQQPVTTDEGGQYYFAKVQSVHAQSTDTGVINPPITVSVIGPEGYLNATVLVTPSAQIDGNADTGAGAPTNPVTTFIDGFVAEATVAVLPKLEASVNGYIRNILTGEPIVNTRVSLDMTGIAAAGGGNTLAGPNGNLSFQTHAYNAMTDATGKFEILGQLPSDSTFNVYVDGYNNAGQVAAPPVPNLAATVTTQEDEIVNMGNVFVTPIVANDTIPPTVLATVAYSGVPQQAGTCPVTVTKGLDLTPVATMPELRDKVDGSEANPIVINFSEAMVNGGSEKIYVRQWIAGKGISVDIPVTSVTMGADNKSVSLVLASPLPMGPTRFDVMFMRDAWTDMAGNPITVAAVAPYDSLGPNTSTVILEMCTFKDITSGTPGTLVQSSGGEAAEDQTNDYVGTITDHSQNLDMSSTYVPTAGPRLGTTVNTAMDRLDELEDARGGVFTHDSNTARLMFTAGNASKYTITIVRTAIGVTKVGAVPAGNITIFNDLNIQQGGALSSGGTLPPVVNESVYAINVTNAIPTDTVSIQPTDAFGYPIGDPATYVLSDNTRPTTVLQHAYRDDNAGTTAPAVVATTGDGGELAWQGQVPQIGIPLLPITPHLIDILDTSGKDISAAAGLVADRSLRAELLARSLDGNTADALTWAGMNTYDTTAYNKMVAAGLGRNIGVAFSEDVVLSADPVQSTTAGFGTCVAQNNTTVRVNEALVSVGDEDGAAGVVNTANEALDEADLVRCTTSNVLTLANVDNGQVIDFNTVIADSAGNKTTADSRAQVVVKDDMPPFMTFAAFDGQVLNLQFNEPVSIANGPTLTFIDPTGVNANVSLPLSAANTVVDSTGMKLSVTPANQSAGMLLNMVDVPNLATINNTYVYAEDGAYYQSANYPNSSVPPRAPQANTRLGHGILDYSSVQDIRGNSWIDWIDPATGSYADVVDKYSDMADTTDINRRVAFANPRFAVVDALGRFESTISVDGYVTTTAGNAVNSTNSDQVVVISFSHPVKWDGFNNTKDGLNSNVDAPSDSNINPIITLAELNLFYQVGGGAALGQQFKDNGTPDLNDLAVVSNGGRTLTLRFRTTQPVTSLLNGTLRLVDTAGSKKFFTSALIAGDRDGGTSTTIPGPDQVFDPQTVYGAGTSISPKQ